MGKIVAIANQKGGVGKTTTAVNLSAALAEQKKRVLLIDLDPQGNATSGLGIDRRALTKSVYDVLISQENIKTSIVTTRFSALAVCPSSISLSGAEIELVSIERREYQLKQATDGIKNEYDYIIIDCPPSLGLITLNALAAADTVLVPIQCEFYALEGLAQLTNTIRIVKKGINPELDIEGVLLTMFNGRTNLSIQVVDEVKRFFKDKVYKTVIPRNVRLSEAPGYGEPVTTYDRHSKGAESYRALADEFLKKNKR